MKNLKFCSVLSKESDEPLAGSAPHAEHFIFISWPKKLWGIEALEAKGGFPKGLKNWMHENSKYYGKISIRLASKEETNNKESDIFIYPGGFFYPSVSPKKIVEFLDLHFKENLYSSSLPAKLNNDQIFICTHGRHDKCCAKYGKKVADLMSHFVAKKKLNTDIWESSHLGGHRFAATLIDFPNGYSYGRLTPEEIPIFFKCRKANNVYSPAYRGSVFLSNLEQTAEANIQNYFYEKKLFQKVEIKNIKEINGEKFSCIAKFRYKKKMKKYQAHFPEESVFNFVLKEYENPSSCSSIKEFTTRNCWEIESTENI